MSEHPDSARLEEMAAGNADAETAAHVNECAACAAYVTSLATQAKAFAAREDAAAFMAKVVAKSRALPQAPSRASAKWGRVMWIAAPLAAAAALLLLVRSPAHDGDRDREPSATSARFKGGVELAVVRERDGHQDRAAGEVRVRRGDRLRLEVSLDEERPIAAGILEIDGTWTPLFVPTVLEAGVHFSPEAARWSDDPKSGWILAGAPEEVDRARASKDFTKVSVLRIMRDQ
jgi:hypothetical protein